MAAKLLFLALWAACAAAVVRRDSAGSVSVASSQANPVRKVVSMLQSMQKKVQAEGEKEAELFEKFMCYCKTGTGNLAQSISAAEAKIPQVTTDLKAAEAQLAETKEGLKQDQVDRSAAKTAIQEATALREKENAAFVAEKDEAVANIEAITKAVAALNKGMAGAFVQTATAGRLVQVVKAQEDMLEEDRQALLSFLSGSGSYAPSSGSIVGLLNQLGDSMASGLAAATAAEEKAAYSYGMLVKAKTKEVDALTQAVEAKTKKIGELGVAIVQMKDDIEDTTGTLDEDKQFLQELTTGCSTKSAEWEERKKLRAAELLALADTIKILNDDDALELFKKTLPAPGSASFVQVQSKALALRQKALTELQRARGGNREDHVQVDLIMLALSGKKVSFDKVIKMIDEMVGILKEEQLDDDHKKEYCQLQLDQADDKKKSLENTLEDEAQEIEKCTTGIQTLAEEIAALTKGIKALDTSVAEATEQRKEENDEYKDLIAADSASKQLLDIAKNRLNKFYNPSLYKPPAKQELSAEDRIVSNMGAAAFFQRSLKKDAPPPPPETFGAYSKKGEESTGVIGMIDLLIKDLDLEMTEAETEEKEAQKEYEQLMADSAKKRAEDSKALADKESAKADMEVDLANHKAAQKDAFKAHQATMKYIMSLHTECDWLAQYYDVRKEARSGEIDSLTSAKAVLSGASFSLLETHGAGASRSAQ